MKKRKFLAACLGMAMISGGYAQTTWTPFDNEPTDPMMGYNPAPQTWSFIKYGNTPVDLYTGTARVDIPIYIYSDNDFTLSIGAGYASNGFVPSRQTGILGLNWFLNCGGVITREINGLPDDMMITGAFRNGFMLNSDVSYEDDQLLNMNIGQEMQAPDFHYVIGDSGNCTETEPDVFHFSFMGHSGSFMLDGRRNVRVFDTEGDNGTYDIDLHITGNTSVSYIVITTGDGYEYTFGAKDADSKCLERSIKGNYTGLATLFRCSPQDQWPIVSWYLSKIKAPNGRQVTFDYFCPMSTVPTGIYPNANNAYIVTFSSGINSVSSQDGGNVVLHKYADIIQTTYLSGIKVDGGIDISLDYSPKECCEIIPSEQEYEQEWDTYTNTVQKLLKLDRISVRNAADTTRTIRQCDFYYRTKDNRTILDSLTLSGEGTYRMSYYEDKPYADILSTKVDFWNYYNGITGWLGATTVDAQTLNETIANNQNDPSFEYGVTGCLHRIDYPTKGFTEFEYESNTAYYAVLKVRNPILDRDTVSISLPPDGKYPVGDNPAFLARKNYYDFLFKDSNECGGVRIKRITDHDADNGIVVREFKYAENGHSSGTMLHFPRYYTFNSSGTNIVVPLIQSTTNTFDKSHIEYSCVTECRSDGSRIQYDFSCYSTDPDDYEGQCCKAAAAVGAPICDSVYITNVQRKPNSRHCRRGKLLSKTYFDSGNNIVKSERFVYADHNAGDKVNYVAFTVPAGYYYYSGKIFIGDNRLTDKITTVYEDGRTLTTSEHIDYNAIGQISCKSLADAAGSVTRSYIRYLHEGAAASDPVLTKHQLTYLAAVMYTIQRAGAQERAVAASRYGYSEVNGTLLKPNRIETAEISVPAAVSSDGVFSTELPYTTSLTFDSYDRLGNIRQTTDRSGTSTCYIWGYGGRYPLARLSNITLGGIRSRISNFGDGPFTAGLTDVWRKALMSLPAVATLYDYLPNIGLIRLTDFSGNELYYEYDVFGRLVETRDDNGIIERYEYHF